MWIQFLSRAEHKIMPILSKVIYRFTTIVTKTPKIFSIKLEKNPETHTEPQKTLNSQRNFEKEE